jgi:hypothetical protein
MPHTAAMVLHPDGFPDYGLTVRVTEDEHGHPVYTVFDKAGICESAPHPSGLDPAARVTWARDQGMSSAEIAAAARGDGLLHRGISFSAEV